ncbi:MAG: L-histidine N(alpha)-methyltransferase [Cyanobacteria bacterium P01_A01_bin.114]
MDITQLPTVDETTPAERLHLDNLLDSEVANPTEGRDVLDGLTQTPKALPPKYFYDQRGSVLFEKICDLPEYYLTRTETAIFRQYSPEIVRLTGPCELAELGSGSATKTRILLDAYQAKGMPLRYIPIDVSDTMLKDSSQRLLEDYPGLKIHGLVSTYEPALNQLPPLTLPTRMLCFIGSTLGNLQPQECDRFLAQVSAALDPGQYFLLGLDLQKEKSLLEAAYNDSQGITAAFNLNMLAHLSWRFEGDFDLGNFAHVAFYNEEAHQIEIYLESLKAQTVHLKQLNLSVAFEKGERLLSEISRKFNLSQMQENLAQHHLQVVHSFTDENEWFGLILCRRC